MTANALEMWYFANCAWHMTYALSYILMDTKSAFFSWPFPFFFARLCAFAYRHNEISVCFGLIFRWNECLFVSSSVAMAKQKTMEENDVSVGSWNGKEWKQKAVVPESTHLERMYFHDFRLKSCEWSGDSAKMILSKITENTRNCCHWICRFYLRHTHTKVHTEKGRQAETGIHRPKRKYQSLHIAIATLFLFRKKSISQPKCCAVLVCACLFLSFAQQKQHKNSFGLHSFIVWWARDENPNTHTQKEREKTHKQIKNKIRLSYFLCNNNNICCRNWLPVQRIQVNRLRAAHWNEDAQQAHKSLIVFDGDKKSVVNFCCKITISCSLAVNNTFSADSKKFTRIEWFQSILIVLFNGYFDEPTNAFRHFPQSCCLFFFSSFIIFLCVRDDRK